MEWIVSLAKDVAAPLLVGGLGWLARGWSLGRKACADKDLRQDFVTLDEYEAFQSRLASELAAGNERMDASAEVDAFVVTWLPVMCESMEVKPVDCQAMKAAAAALLTKVLNAGRAPRGGQQGSNHAR